MSAKRISSFEKTNPFVLILIFAAVIIGLLMIARGILRLLSVVAPILLIAAIIINYRVVLGYIKWLGGTLKRNPLMGILAIIFSIIGFPIVAAFLLLRALSSRNIGRSVSKKGEYIKYEEVNDDFLDLSDLKEHKKKMDNDYNDVIK